MSAAGPSQSWQSGSHSCTFTAHLEYLCASAGPTTSSVLSRPRPYILRSLPVYLPHACTRPVQQYAAPTMHGLGPPAGTRFPFTAHAGHCCGPSAGIASTRTLAGRVSGRLVCGCGVGVVWVCGAPYPPTHVCTHMHPPC